MNLQHLAIIMDGNRRWAKDNGLSANEGHQMGAKNLWSILKKTNDLEIKYLTVFGFSTENWKRSRFRGRRLVHLKHFWHCVACEHCRCVTKRLRRMPTKFVGDCRHTVLLNGPKMLGQC